MEFKQWNGFCLCSLGGTFPPDCETVKQPFAPLVFLVKRDPLRSRGLFAVRTLDEVFEAEGPAALLPASLQHTPCESLRDFVASNGASVLNTEFHSAFSFLKRVNRAKSKKLRVTLVGLGDVGGTLLTALKLLGTEIAELSIYDPNVLQCSRYEIELNQVLPLSENAVLPPVTICPKEHLFDCDLFLFTASRGVPAVGSGIQDVRMAQFATNREMLSTYAKQAREAHFGGLFCQISDPVDQLARVVFLESNRNSSGNFDACGLLPEQIQGFGLGVMAARAAYYAHQKCIPFTEGRVYGPHGENLIVANHPEHYDPALSEYLTRLTVHANLQMRELGFKPYIAPALSSAAISILQLVRGQTHHGAIPMGSTYFGCRSQYTSMGILPIREALSPALYERIDAAYQQLEYFDYDA